MKKLLLLVALALGFCLHADAQCGPGQVPIAGNRGCRNTGAVVVRDASGNVPIGTMVLGPKTIAAGADHLPDAAVGNAGWVTIVTDSTDCVNAGVGVSLCRSTGTAWAPLGGGPAPTIASQTEAETGADNTKMMTPQRTAQAFNAQMATVIPDQTGKAGMPLFTDGVSAYWKDDFRPMSQVGRVKRFHVASDSTTSSGTGGTGMFMTLNAGGSNAAYTPTGTTDSFGWLLTTVATTGSARVVYSGPTARTGRSLYLESAGHLTQLNASRWWAAWGQSYAAFSANDDPTTSQHGVGFRYSSAIGPNIYCYSNNGAAPNALTDSGVAAGAGAGYVFGFLFNDSGTPSVKFFINGLQVCEHTDVPAVDQNLSFFTTITPLEDVAKAAGYYWAYAESNR